MKLNEMVIAVPATFTRNLSPENREQNIRHLLNALCLVPESMVGNLFRKVEIGVSVISAPATGENLYHGWREWVKEPGVEEGRWQETGFVSGDLTLSDVEDISVNQWVHHGHRESVYHLMDEYLHIALPEAPQVPLSMVEHNDLIQGFRVGAADLQNGRNRSLVINYKVWLPDTMVVRGKHNWLEHVFKGPHSEFVEFNVRARNNTVAA